MEERIKFHVGLDVHKNCISVAAADPGRVPGRLVGKVVHGVAKLLKVLAKIGTAEQLHIVYEAGPTGFGLQRHIIYRGLARSDVFADAAPAVAGGVDTVAHRAAVLAG